MYEVAICTATGKVLKRFDLTEALARGKTISIGRADDCDISIRAEGISRHHCEIAAEDMDDYVVRDLSSTHGTYVDGVRVDEVEIRPGLAVQIGPALLRFQATTPRIARDLQQELGAGGDDL